MNFIDADIGIEILRKTLQAREWFYALGEELAVPGFVAMELILGCQDSTELRKVKKFLTGFPIVWASETAMAHALNDLAPLKLSCGIGAMDCFIAATAKEHNATLYTFNKRHFRHVPDLTFIEPYSRPAP